MNHDREIKFNLMVKCFQDRTLVKASKLTGYDNPVERTGLISRMPERCSGLWGCGGDSVAIYVDNEPFPLETTHTYYAT
jgi:hypothetical protein